MSTLKVGDGIVVMVNGEIRPAYVVLTEVPRWTRRGTVNDGTRFRVAVDLVHPSHHVAAEVEYADEGVTWCPPGMHVDYEAAFRVANALADHKNVVVL